MILQALYDYYQRKAADPDSGIAPEGFIEKKIDFVVVLNIIGSYVKTDSLQEHKGKRLEGKSFFVPAIGKQAIKHTNAGTDANLLWDNSGFILGIGNNGTIKRLSFLDTILNYYVDPPSDIQAIITFLKKEHEQARPFNQLLQHPDYGDAIRSGSPNITFKIDGDSEPIISKAHVIKAISSLKAISDILGTCLITGDSDVPIEINHMATKGIIGGQTSGSYIVSFNKPSFNSYNKKKSTNAPVSKKATSEYTKALQYLIYSERNKVRLVDTTIIFWSKIKTDFENVFSSFFAVPISDYPDADVREVKGLYEGIYSGHISSETVTRFYVLGLAPNEARISIRFWHEGTIQEFGDKIQQHFNAFEIIRSANDKGRYSIFWIITAMARINVFENQKPNLSGQQFQKLILKQQDENRKSVPAILSGQIVQAVLSGSLYPATMLQQTIRRVRATRDVSRMQASILKAYLTRYYRIHTTKEKEITVALDTANNNPGYRLGRLFAVLEKIQEKASSTTLNATIRDRFYGAASSTPVTVFPQLLKLKNHHLAKINNGWRKHFERLIGEIIDGLSGNMPSHLAMEDQARFAIGYYHQRQDFFKKKDSDNKNEIQGEKL